MRKLDYAIFAMILAAFAIMFYNHFQKHPKIAYVRSQELVYGYDGTKEAMSQFNNKKQKLLANADTLKAEFQRDFANYKREYPTLSKMEIKKYESKLARKEKQVKNYSEAINKKIKSNDDEMMQAVLNQINSYAKEYGKQHGYTLILGTTLSGNVLYGEDAIDITDDLLTEINKKYHGE